jgi:ArsR family metal-binding transcriptional regulator
MKITIAKADDIIDAWHILDEIKALINKTYEKRSDIKPNYDEKVKVTALQIYGWLPKTNCRLCAEATCLAFACRLLLGEQKLSNCVPLSTEQKFTENKKIMQELAEVLGVS